MCAAKPKYTQRYVAIKTKLADAPAIFATFWPFIRLLVRPCNNATVHAQLVGSTRQHPAPVRTNPVLFSASHSPSYAICLPAF